MKPLAHVAVLLALIALGACRAGGKVAAHERLNPDAAALRAAFNADAGKVRVLMLVSPT